MITRTRPTVDFANLSLENLVKCEVWWAYPHTRCHLCNQIGVKTKAEFRLHLVFCDVKQIRESKEKLGKLIKGLEKGEEIPMGCRIVGVILCIDHHRRMYEDIERLKVFTQINTAYDWKDLKARG